MCNAAAHTIHIAQSATFRQIYIDMSTHSNPPKHWWQHMHYVALSRVTSLSGLYLKDLNEEKICISRIVAYYIAEARKDSKLVPSYLPLCTYRTDQLKIIYNNCRSYKKHYSDIEANYNMMAADIICIAKTPLGPADKVVNSNMKGYKLYRLDQAVAGNTYHGLILYMNDNICVPSCTIPFPIIVP